MSGESIWDIDTSEDFQFHHCFQTGTASTHNYPIQKLAFNTFDEINFNSELQKAIQMFSYHYLNEVQKNSLPLFLDNSNYSGLVCAPRGSGKTVTIILIALEVASRSKIKNHPQIIILCKTYELAKKMYEKAEELASLCTDITLRLVTRKEIKKNEKITQDIVIGTLEKVEKVAEYGSLDLLNVNTLIINDADGMVPLVGHTNNTMVRIWRQLETNCRLILFSSTKTKKLAYFMDKYAKFATEVIIPPKSRPMQKIFLLCSDMSQKIEAMILFTTKRKYPGQSVIICNKKETASLLIKKCKDLPLCLLDKSLKTKERENVAALFNEGAIERLVVTPVFTKIIDKSNVSVIFNFDQLLNKDNQLDYEAYEERSDLIGIGRQGIVVNVIENDWAPSILPEGTRDQFGSEIMSYESLFNVN